MDDIKLVVAEDFHSIQGEGEWAGTPMHFIRLAGCNVGRHPTTCEYEVGRTSDFPILKTGRTAYVCHTYDNRMFWCDTDFQRGTPTTCREVITNTWENHICITGGEPLLQLEAIKHLAVLLEDFLSPRLIHIETSGTIYFEREFPCWITCSPKQGYNPRMLEESDEIKLLVDPTFDLDKLPGGLEYASVYIQPINNETSVNLDNLKLCLDILRKRPNWRLSVQLHKLFGWD